MLDLSIAFGRNYYELKLFDGTILHLMRPNQGTQQAVLDMVPILQDSSKQVEAIEGMSRIFIEILNNNDDGLTFTVESLGERYSIEIMSYVVGDYFTHWNKEITDNVNFHSAQ